MRRIALALAALLSAACPADPAAAPDDGGVADAGGVDVVDGGGAGTEGEGEGEGEDDDADAGFVPADGGFRAADGGFVEVDGGLVPQDGGFVAVDGGFVPAGGPDFTALSTATGCGGVFNPDQLLDLRVTMSGWSSLKADMTNSTMFEAQLSCGGSAPITIGIRRKRSGGDAKPGVKIDVNEYVPGQTWFGLKKLSLENGISEGSGEASMQDLVAEYLSWRFFTLSGAVSGRAAFTRLYVNDELIGVYVNVEQVDKAFLESRGIDDSGWLYKKSGSADDGYKTNEAEANPFESDFCFWEGNCAPPASLDTWLPAHLDVPQMLLFGGVNAAIANMDAPIRKGNNYYFYDVAGRTRLYIPWDLDTVMKQSPSLFGVPQGAGATTKYVDVLFAHWEDDYDALMTSLLADRLTVAAGDAELARVVAVAGAALQADPSIVGETTQDAADALAAWWSARHEQLTTELGAH